VVRRDAVHLLGSGGNPTKYIAAPHYDADLYSRRSDIRNFAGQIRNALRMNAKSGAAREDFAA
jgi:hypothetical protein